MKKLISLSLVVLLAFTFLGCSKDDDETEAGSGQYYFRFKLNEQQMDYTDLKFTHNLSGSFNLVDNKGYYTTSVVGLKTYPTNTNNTITIVLGHPEEFQANQDYTNFEAAGNIVTQTFVLGYYNENGVFYHAEINQISVFGGETDAKVKFTEVTPTNIKGTFSGSLYTHTGSVKITQGEFNVPRY